MAMWEWTLTLITLGGILDMGGGGLKVSSSTGCRFEVDLRGAQLSKVIILFPVGW